MRTERHKRSVFRIKTQGYAQKSFQMEPNQTSQDELNAEAEALQVSKEDEIRASVINEYGFDEVDDAERIDKLVSKELKSKQMLSEAIGQKIKYREQAQKGTLPPAPAVAPKTPEVNLDKVQELMKQTLEQRDLESLELPDDIKADIQKVAKTQGISVKQAQKDPYIQFKLGEYEKTQKAEEAAITRKPNASGKISVSLDEDPPDLDTSSPEAFEKSSKKLEEWKSAMKAKGY
jgi:hypothetical protein